MDFSLAQLLQGYFFGAIKTHIQYTLILFFHLQRPSRFPFLESRRIPLIYCLVCSYDRRHTRGSSTHGPALSLGPAPNSLQLLLPLASRPLSKRTLRLPHHDRRSSRRLLLQHLHWHGINLCWFMHSITWHHQLTKTGTWTPGPPLT